MQYYRHHRRLLVRATAAASLAVYLLVATGVPLPVWRSVPKSTAERFPCERSACGCSSAEQCWTKCCCRNLAANLAWARGEGVRPPEFALAIARAQGFDTSAWDGPEGHSARPTLVAAGSTNEKRCCCCTARGECAADASGDRQDPSTPDVESSSVVFLQSLACQGLLRAWLTVGSAPPPAVVDTRVELTRTAEHLTFLSESATSLADTIDPPPPKLRTS